MNSPTSWGTSWAIVESATVSPSGAESRKAPAMTTPSTKLWKASPMSRSGPELAWTSQSCLWQWRQTSSFSSTKNGMRPTRITGATVVTGNSLAAWGIIPSSAAPSSVPVEKLIRRGSARSTSDGRTARTVLARRTDTRPPASADAMISRNVTGEPPLIEL